MTINYITSFQILLWGKVDMKRLKKHEKNPKERQFFTVIGNSFFQASKPGFLWSFS